MYLLFNLNIILINIVTKKHTIIFVISKIKQMQETENYAPMNEERKTLTIDK